MYQEKCHSLCACSWRRIKHDFLHHFHKPRLDLLTWILMTKLIPNYYNKVEVLLNYNGRLRNLPQWRKAFKRAWKHCAKTVIRNPDEPRYTTDPQAWICSCRAFVTSRFLICKHIIQAVHPVSPRFFKEVKRRRTAPFWQHPDLRPIDNREPVNIAETNPIHPADPTLFEDDEDDESESGDGNIDDVDLQMGQSFDEDLDDQIASLRYIADMLEYQRQFRDIRFLEAYKREAARLNRYGKICQQYEKRINSTQTTQPRTWDPDTPQFFRTRPRPQDRDS